MSCVPYPLTLFIGCLIVNMFICLEQSSPEHLEHIQNVTSVIKPSGFGVSSNNLLLKHQFLDCIS